MPYILTVSISVVFKNVFLFLQELLLLWISVYNSLIKICIDVYIRCLICHFSFCFELNLFYRAVYSLNYICFTEQCIVRVLFESQNKHLAYTESKKNIRLKFVPKERRDRGWVWPVKQVGVRLILIFRVWNNQSYYLETNTPSYSQKPRDNMKH